MIAGQEMDIGIQELDVTIEDGRACAPPPSSRTFRQDHHLNLRPLSHLLPHRQQCFTILESGEHLLRNTMA